MNIHYLQHVPFEKLGVIETWAEENKHTVTETRLFENTDFPLQESFDWLFVMGGPMNIYEEKTYPWLREEKKFIQDTIKHGKHVMGICLGAQLIADVCGAKVFSNKYSEIGWFPVANDRSEKHPEWVRSLSSEFQAFHWHGDTFEIPEGAASFLASEACAHQGFYMDGGRIIGLQCHFELEAKGVHALIAECYDGEKPGPFVQDKEEIRNAHDYFENAHAQLFLILDRWSSE